MSRKQMLIDELYELSQHLNLIRSLKEILPTNGNALTRLEKTIQKLMRSVVREIDKFDNPPVW